MIDEFYYRGGTQDRIDKILTWRLEGYTRSYLKKLIKEKNVLVNEKEINPSYILKNNDHIKILISQPKTHAAEPQNIPLEIVFEDEHMLVVNKPQGMVVHPACANYSGTLANALIHHCGESLSGINGVLRPGIVHRIDKDTSGLLLVAKNDRAHVGLQNQIKNHSLTREYKAIVHGLILVSGDINKPIGRSKTDRKKMAITYRNSREAITHFFPIKVFENYTYIKLRLETGRTHQIRVHMKSLGHPIVGDKTYGVKSEKFVLPGQLLHAYRLGFNHPISGKYLEFESLPPKEFMNFLSLLEAGSV